MFTFESQFVKTDVTAVNIRRNYIFVGVGNFLQIFDGRTLKQLKKIKVFEGQKIYGIITNTENNKIVLYGGLNIKIFSTNDEFTEIYNYKAKDWILDLKWIENDTKIAIVYMHNILHIWDSNYIVNEEVQCEGSCILYSAKICFDKFDELTVLAGTVFNEILIWKPTRRKNNNGVVLKKLRNHNGVIFSLDYNEKSGFICSTSDDRSATLWQISREDFLNLDNDIEINAVSRVYGHLSRTFRCKVLTNTFLTAGEDSLINIWSFSGDLVRKIETHQGAPIWALDCNEELNFVVTGGGDCGVTTFPLFLISNEQNLVVKTSPKIVGILYSGNLVTFSESGILYYYVRSQKKWVEIKEFEDLKCYVLLEVSVCRKLFALAGFQGQITIYREENNEIKQVNFLRTTFTSRIFSLHWLNCKSFVICQTEGRMTLFYLNNNSVVPISNFVLPLSKERWTTTALFVRNNHLIVGDRKGHIHLYKTGRMEPVQTLKKVHNHLGVTKLINDHNEIKSLGRNGSVKTFSIKNDTLELSTSNKLPLSWLVNKIGDLLLAFSGKNFVVWSLETNRILFEKSCGGGHRSWDFYINIDKVTFIYIKDKIIHLVDFDLKDILPVDLIEGYHAKEINSVKALKIFDTYVLISGGEDTSLKISSVKENNSFQNLASFKSHLSSIRAITIYNIKNSESYLVFSAGGRAQVISWKLDITTENNSLKKINFTEQHSYYKVIDCQDSEMRIMDLCTIEINGKLMLFCACSDGKVKIFFVSLNENGKFSLSFCRDFFYKLKCIIKINKICIFSHKILITMATDGKIVFWDVTDVLSKEIKPFYSIQAHQSGINSNSFILQNDLCVLLTGGDDNAIVLTAVRFKVSNNVVTMEKIDSFEETGRHCAQITGTFINNKYFLTSSIDQRVILFKWKLENEKIVCEYITKYNTSVADLQGLECFGTDCFDVFIYGKGLEYIKLKE